MSSAEVAAKLDRVRGWLTGSGYGVALFTKPSSLLTLSGFERAMTVLAAVGGSTNAIIHLCAVAGRRGLSLPLREFAEVAARVPVIADVAPVGTGLMDDLARAGGVPAVLAALAGEPARWPLVSLDSPVTSLPAFMVVRGNLAPDGAVIKAAAASPSLLRHRGPAVVFHSLRGNAGLRG